MPDSDSQILIYQPEDGRTRIDVRLEDETVWLNQAQMVDLFQSSKQNISLHIRNIFSDGELDENSVVKEYLTAAADGKDYRTKHYNLDVVIAVGYRVRSHRGTQFRRWATERLREYLVKGFVMDDERLKQGGGGHYFDELLARIRDIRSSKKVFWRKVLDIYATSVDYDPKTKTSRAFFASIQNKMHWAAHGHTAAEIVMQRADAALPHMGLTTLSGNRPRQADAEIAKNYLNAEEIDALNRIVTAYLEFAELQALNHAPMHMTDWAAKLDDFLKLTGRELLTHAGSVRHEDAAEKARTEYQAYRVAHRDDPSPVEQHFVEAQNAVKRIERAAKGLKPEGKP